MPNSDDAVVSAARELVERHKGEAVSMAAARVKALSEAGRWPEHGIAQRVLSEVERRVRSLKAGGGDE
jgi:hypothetical protein